MTVNNQPSQPNDAERAPQGTFDRDKDEAIAMVGDQQNEIDPAVAARAVRKTDLFLIPAMIVGCEYRSTNLNYLWLKSLTGPRWLGLL